MRQAVTCHAEAFAKAGDPTPENNDVTFDFILFIERMSQDSTFDYKLC
jgi:hypothetical protein